MKRFLFVAITLFAFSAFSAPKKKAPPYKKTPPMYRGVTYFKYTDAKGKKVHESVHVEQDKIRVNAIEIEKKNWSKTTQPIQVVMKVEKVSAKACPKASYSLKVSRNEQKSISEVGCMDTPRFKQIQQAFVTLNGLKPKEYTKDLKPK